MNWVSIPEGTSNPGLLREGKPVPTVPEQGQWGTSSPLSSVPCQAAQRKLRQASTNVKHWNVQMNRLMHPIGPGGRRPADPADHPSLDLLSTAMLGQSPHPHPSSPLGYLVAGRTPREDTPTPLARRDSTNFFLS